MIEPGPKNTWHVLHNVDESASQWKDPTITQVNDGVPCLNLPLNEAVLYYILKVETQSI